MHLLRRAADRRGQWPGLSTSTGSCFTQRRQCMKQLLGMAALPLMVSGCGELSYKRRAPRRMTCKPPSNAWKTRAVPSRSWTTSTCSPRQASAPTTATRARSPSQRCALRDQFMVEDRRRSRCPGRRHERLRHHAGRGAPAQCEDAAGDPRVRRVHARQGLEGFAGGGGLIPDCAQEALASSAQACASAFACCSTNSTAASC